MIKMQYEYFLENEDTLKNIAAKLAKKFVSAQLHKTVIIYLQGQLGAGKTTFVRGFLAALGFNGPVRSPSYQWVQDYQVDQLSVFHFDLYRLQEPEELFYIGLTDCLTDNAICLIEWPENAKGLLPQPTLTVNLTVPADGIGRYLSVMGNELLEEV